MSLAGIFGCRYMGFEDEDANDYVVYDDWAEKEVERLGNKKQGVKRVIELNQPYVELNRKGKKIEEQYGKRRR